MPALPERFGRIPHHPELLQALDALLWKPSLSMEPPLRGHPAAEDAILRPAMRHIAVAVMLLEGLERFVLGMSALAQDKCLARNLNNSFIRPAACIVREESSFKAAAKW